MKEQDQLNASGAPASEEEGDVKTDEQLWADLDAEDQAKPEDDDDLGEDLEDAADDTGSGEEDGESEGDPEGSSEGDEGLEPEDQAEEQNGTSVEELKAQIERLKHSLDSEKGRTAASRREIERLQGQIADTRKRVEDSQVDETSRKEREEKLNAAAEEYGDVIGPLIEEVREQSQRQELLTAAEKRRLADNEARLDDMLAEQQAVFEQEHPDGLSVIQQNGEVFRQWIDDRPKYLRDIFEANFERIVDGTGAALLVSEFKRSLRGADDEPPASKQTQTGSTRRQRQLDGARSERGRGSQMATSEIPPNADEKALWDYWERKDRKR